MKKIVFSFILIVCVGATGFAQKKVEEKKAEKSKVNSSTSVITKTRQPVVTAVNKGAAGSNFIVTPSDAIETATKMEEKKAQKLQKKD